jgi:glycogen(starch) synthase
MAGSFVAEHARLVRRLADQVEVVHGLEWPGGTAEVVAGLRPAFDAVLAAARAQGSLTVAGASGPVTRVPVMITGGMTVPERAEALVADVRRGVGALEGDLVHGHVGYLGGLVAARLAGPGTRVFATEHSSGLAQVLADPQGRDQYAEVLDRAERLLCVSGHLRDQVVAAFPEHAATVAVLPNLVDLAAIPARTAPLTALRRWVFVGGLNENKGVERVVRAFALVAADDDLHLTVYGDGPLRGRLEELATEAGVRDRLDLRGVVPHGQLLAELHTHDLLLAPSRFETFHLAVPEAVAAGLAVLVTPSGGPQESLAGIEDLVGRFVPVEDDPDSLVDGYRALAADLGSLDLPAARAVLEGRFGTAAVTDRLAALYGVPVPVDTPGPAAAPVDDRQGPVVLLAASGWRRYAVQADLEAVSLTGTPTTVVTTDAGLVALAEEHGQQVLAPSALLALPPVVRRPGLRPALGRLRRSLTAPRTPSAALPPGTRVVVTDCHSARLAEQLLTRYDGLRVSFELAGGDGPPADAREGGA